MDSVAEELLYREPSVVRLLTAELAALEEALGGRYCTLAQLTRYFLGKLELVWPAGTAEPDEAAIEQVGLQTDPLCDRLSGLQEKRRLVIGQTPERMRAAFRLHLKHLEFDAMHKRREFAPAQARAKRLREVIEPWFGSAELTDAAPEVLHPLNLVVHTLYAGLIAAGEDFSEVLAAPVFPMDAEAYQQQEIARLTAEIAALENEIAQRAAAWSTAYDIAVRLMSLVNGGIDSRRPGRRR